MFIYAGHFCVRKKVENRNPRSEKNTRGDG